MAFYCNCFAESVMNAPTPLHALSAHTVNGHATPEAWQLALGRHTRTPEAQALAPLLRD